MKNILTATAKWDDNRNYWKINVQKDGVRRSFYEKTPGKRGKALCEMKATEWLNGRSLTDPKFSDAWKGFLEQREKDICTAYYNDTVCAGKNWILPVLGNKKLSSITSMDVQRVADSMAAAGRTAKTIRDALSHITQFATYCRKNRYEFEAPQDIVNRGAAKQEKRVLHKADIRRIFAEETDEPYINAFRFCIATGMRRGEVAGLQWDDIHDDRIQIKRSINRLQEVTDGKNANARRRVPMNSMLRKILDDQRQLLKNEGIVSPWVFPSPVDAAQPDPNNMYKHWSAFCKDMGIDHVSFHEIRHTMISMFQADMPEEYLKRVVGHSESMDTFGQYGHEMDEDAERTADIMEKVLGRYIG